MGTKKVLEAMERELAYEWQCAPHGDRKSAKMDKLHAIKAAIADQEELAKFRALAKRAAEFAARSVQRWEDRDALLAELAELHKENT